MNSVLLKKERPKTPFWLVFLFLQTVCAKRFFFEKVCLLKVKLKIFIKNYLSSENCVNIFSHILLIKRNLMKINLYRLNERASKQKHLSKRKKEYKSVVKNKAQLLIISLL